MNHKKMAIKCKLFIIAVLGSIITVIPTILRAEDSKHIQESPSSKGQFKTADQLATSTQFNQAFPPRIRPDTKGLRSSQGPPGSESNRPSIGWQGESPGQAQGSGASTQGTQQGQKLPGGPSWQKVDQEGDTKAMSISDFSKEAAIKKLLVPRGVPEDMPDANDLRTGGMDQLGQLGMKRFSDAGFHALESYSENSTDPAFTIERGAGKNFVSKTQQQSGGERTHMGGDIYYMSGGEPKGQRKIYDTQGNYMGTQSELKKTQDEQLWGGMTQTERVEYKRTADKEHAAGVKDKAAAEAEAQKQDKEKQETFHAQTQNAGDHPAPPPPGSDTVAMPTPDSTDGVHMPYGLGKTPPPKTAEQLRQEKLRKVSLGNDDKRHIERINIKPTSQDMSKKRTDGLTNPVEGRDGNDVPATLGGFDSDEYGGFHGVNNENLDIVTPGKKHGGGGDPPPGETEGAAHKE